MSLTARVPDWLEQHGRARLRCMTEGSAGAARVGQAKDIPLIGEELRTTHRRPLVRAQAQRLTLGSRRQGLFGVTVRREMNKTIE